MFPYINFLLFSPQSDITLGKTPPRNGEGSVYVTPPALSGKGDGGLGRIPLPQPLPGTERGVFQLLPLPFQGRGTGG